MKIGINECSCTGSESFVAEQIPQLLDYMKPLGTAFQQKGSDRSSSGGDSLLQPNLGINSIAAKLGAKSGADLVLASVFSLALGGKEQASRAEIITEMKKAKSYFKASFVSNMSNQLTSLIKDGKLLEQASEHYALSAQTRMDLEGKLA